MLWPFQESKSICPSENKTVKSIHKREKQFEWNKKLERYLSNSLNSCKHLWDHEQLFWRKSSVFYRAFHELISFAFWFCFSSPTNTNWIFPQNYWIISVGFVKAKQFKKKKLYLLTCWLNWNWTYQKWIFFMYEKKKCYFACFKAILENSIQWICDSFTIWFKANS